MAQRWQTITFHMSVPRIFTLACRTVKRFCDFASFRSWTQRGFWSNHTEMQNVILVNMSFFSNTVADNHKQREPVCLDWLAFFDRYFRYFSDILPFIHWSVLFYFLFICCQFLSPVVPYLRGQTSRDLRQGSKIHVSLGYASQEYWNVCVVLCRCRAGEVHAGYQRKW